MPETGRGGIAPVPSRSGDQRKSCDGLVASLSASGTVAMAIAGSQKKKKGETRYGKRGAGVRGDTEGESEVESKRREREKEGRKYGEEGRDREDHPMEITIDDSSEEEELEKGRMGIKEGMKLETFELRACNEREKRRWT